MSTHEFIFSSKSKYRWSRHYSLWVVFCLYFFVVNFFPGSAEALSDPATYIEAFRKMIYVPICIISVYVSIYVLLPNYLLKGRYGLFFILVACLSIINLVNAYLLTMLLARLTTSTPFDQLPVQFTLFQPVIYGWGLGLSASGFAVIIKLLKIRYLKERENERLLQQKISTELQLIKTNFHPHFLADALQNISFLIRHDSAQSPSVILKLADLLSYILYENETEKVPLSQELHMIKEYLDLEKVFYRNRIVIHFKEEGDTAGMKIAPLVLLSLIQNCCEQFLISLQEKLHINILAKSENNQLHFELRCNGYYQTINGVSHPYAGLNNALRRIQVLYKGRHRLKTNSENDFFSMVLFLELKNLPEIALKESEENTLYVSA